MVRTWFDPTGSAPEAMSLLTDTDRWNASWLGRGQEPCRARSLKTRRGCYPGLFYKHERARHMKTQGDSEDREKLSNGAITPSHLHEQCIASFFNTEQQRDFTTDLHKPKGELLSQMSLSETCWHMTVIFQVYPSYIWGPVTTARSAQYIKLSTCKHSYCCRF